MNGSINSIHRTPSAGDGLQGDGVRRGDLQKAQQAGRDFEALLLTQLLKSARQASSAGWMGEGQGVEQSVAMEMAEGALAKTMAEGDALGLARLVSQAHSLRPVQPAGDPTPPPAEDSAPAPSKRSAES